MGVVDGVDEQGPLSVVGVVGKGAVAGGGVDLVGEDFRAVVLPAEDVGADDPVVAVVVDLDAASGGQRFVEELPGGGGGRSCHSPRRVREG